MWCILLQGLCARDPFSPYMLRAEKTRSHLPSLVKYDDGRVLPIPQLSDIVEP